MSTIRLIAGNDIKRQFAQPFAWILLALTSALLAWQFLIALDAYLRLAPKLDALPNSQGATDLIAIPLLRSLSGLLLLVVPLATMQSLAGERLRIPCRCCSPPASAISASSLASFSAHSCRWH